MLEVIYCITDEFTFHFAYRNNTKEDFIIINCKNTIRLMNQLGIDLDDIGLEPSYDETDFVAYPNVRHEYVEFLLEKKGIKKSNAMANFIG